MHNKHTLFNILWNFPSGFFAPRLFSLHFDKRTEICWNETDKNQVSTLCALSSNIERSEYVYALYLFHRFSCFAINDCVSRTFLRLRVLYRYSYTPLYPSTNYFHLHPRYANSTIKRKLDKKAHKAQAQPEKGWMNERLKTNKRERSVMDNRIGKPLTDWET